MEETLINLIKTLGYPVLRQGSLPESTKYPDTFFTFWNNQDIAHSNYDNSCALCQYDYDINVYSNDPSTCFDLLASARELLLDEDWIITTYGYDMPSDEITHIGRGLNATKLKGVTN